MLLKGRLYAKTAQESPIFVVSVVIWLSALPWSSVQEFFTDPYVLYVLFSQQSRDSFLIILKGLVHLLFYYLTNKWCLHVRSQGLELPTLIGEK